MQLAKAIALFAVTSIARPTEAEDKSLIIDLENDAVFRRSEINTTDIAPRILRACYSTGATWPERAYVDWAIDEAGDKLAGRYLGQQTRKHCDMSGREHHIDMEIKNIDNDPHWTGVGDINTYFWSIYGQCPRGGWIGTSDFFYR
jgi:hypothetical protein